MNEFYLDPASGKNPMPKRLEPKVSPKITPENQPGQKVSFKKVLKSVVAQTDSSSKVRQDMVAKYKDSLANGTYEVKAQELAEKIIQKIREDKTREII